jgi:glycosyltransferase involved in cell wall biosynthesis
MRKKEKELLLFMPSIEGGGVEKNLIIIGNYLTQHVNIVKLITYGNKFNKKFNKKVKIINPKNIQKNKSKYFKYFICLLLLIKELARNKQTLVFAFQANIYCIILSKFLKFDVLVRSNSSPTGWSKNFYKKFIFKFFLKYAKKIIVNSYAFQKELKKKFKVKAAVIYNPLNTNEIKSMSKHMFKFSFYKKKDIKIINIARFTDQKDHITLLKGFQKISQKYNCKLVIIGYGSNKKLIDNYIKTNKLQKKVKVIGFQLNPYKYINKSDLLILSSIYEGLPNVILEAITLKKFVISANCPTGPQEILNNGKYGYLFKPTNHLDLANKLEKYIKNKNKTKIINQAYKSLGRFDYKKNNDKYLKIIKSYL